MATASIANNVRRLTTSSSASSSLAYAHNVKIVAINGEVTLKGPGALAGLGVGGAAGGIIGALVGMGIPEYEAKRYEGRVKDGDEIARAKAVLARMGGEDIASSGEVAVPASAGAAR